MHSSENTFNLKEIIKGAYPTTTVVKSEALPENYHICAHGDGSIAIWLVNDTFGAFAKLIHQFEEYEEEDYLFLLTMGDFCSVFWAQEFVEKAQSHSLPQKKLIWKKGGYLNVKEQWTAEVRNGYVSIYEGLGGITCVADFGPDSEYSCSYFFPGCDIETVKKYAHTKIKGLPENYR